MVLLDSITLSSADSALLVVDVQKDFAVTRQGFAFFDRQENKKRDDISQIQEAITQRIIPLIERARKARVHIIYIQANYFEGQFPDMPKLCIKGTEGWELYLVAPQEGNPLEKIIPKYSHDPFGGGNGLEDFLKGNNICNLAMAGGSTDGCINTAAYLSLGRGFQPIVLSDCVYTAGYKWNTVRLQKLREFEAHPDIRVVDSDGIQFQACSGHTD